MPGGVVTSRAGRLAVAVVAPFAIICGCNNDPDEVGGTPAVPQGQDSDVSQSSQLASPSDDSESVPAPAVEANTSAAVVAPPPARPVERSFELPPVEPPGSGGDEAIMDRSSDCFMPGSNCIIGDENHAGDHDDPSDQGDSGGISVNPENPQSGNIGGLSDGSDLSSQRDDADANTDKSADNESRPPTQSGSTGGETQE